MIQGPLPSSITNMSNLEVLLLNFNGLTGEIPSLSGMASLGYLSLMQNSLEGPIPDSICSLSSLWYLVLADNKLTGTLPGCIGDLPDLKYILIGTNAMSGSIGSLGSLSRKNSTSLAMVSLGFSGLSLTDQTSVPVNFNPTALDLSSCRLSGKIPEFISKLTELKMLMLGYNNLSGSIPDWLFKLPNLGYLDLSSNNLEGVLPSTINLKKIFGTTSLVVSDNHLQGAVPVLGLNMDLVDLSWNDLIGEIPERSKLGKVKSLSLSGNKLTGKIPDSWCEIGDSLMLLDISSNGLSGPVPSSLGGCKSLVFLDLTRNQFSGEIPPDLFEEGKGIRFLGLGDNLFDGMPRFIQGLENLEVLKMERNRFRGPIPQFIGNVTRLRILILEENFFNGSIPEGLTDLKELQYVDFSNNNLSGPIPEKLSSMTALRSRFREGTMLGYVVSSGYAGVQLNVVVKGSLYHYSVVRQYLTGIDLSRNDLSGNIPFEIGSLQGLYMLNLSGNSLSGRIPQSIGNMSSLESLDLSLNQHDGEIPRTLALLDYLSTLNLSYNNFTGKIPSSPHLDTLSLNGSAYVGNKFLCGAPDGINCTTSTSSDGNRDKVDDAGGEEKVWLYVFVIIGYGFGLIWPFVILYLNPNWRRNYWTKIDGIVTRIIDFFGRDR